MTGRRDLAQVSLADRPVSYWPGVVNGQVRDIVGGHHGKLVDGRR